MNRHMTRFSCHHLRKSIAYRSLQMSRDLRGSTGGNVLARARHRHLDLRTLILIIYAMRMRRRHHRSTVVCVRRIAAPRTMRGLCTPQATSTSTTPPRPLCAVARLVSSVNPSSAPLMRRIQLIICRYQLIKEVTESLKRASKHMICVAIHCRSHRTKKCSLPNIKSLLLIELFNRRLKFIRYVGARTMFWLRRKMIAMRDLHSKEMQQFSAMSY